jgi:hypothetical protein
VNLPEHGKAIDKLDAQIVRLLNERTQHVLAIREQINTADFHQGQPSVTADPTRGWDEQATTTAIVFV